MRIKLEPYNDQWADLFTTLKEEVSMALKEKVIAIEHIGSTAIVGLSAKPVIDILLGVENGVELEEIESDLTSIGFTYIRSEKHLLNHRRTFFKFKHPENTNLPTILDVAERDIAYLGFVEMAHLHCWIHNSPDWIRHIAFRDYLNSHVAVRNDYQRLKTELALKHWDSTLAYSQAKNDFIKAIERKALDWYNAHHTK